MEQILANNLFQDNRILDELDGRRVIEDSSNISSRNISCSLKKPSKNKNDSAKNEIFTKTVDKNRKENSLSEYSNKTALPNKAVVIGDSKISTSSNLRILAGNSYQTNSTIPTICQVSSIGIGHCNRLFIRTSHFSHRNIICSNLLLQNNKIYS